MQSESREEFDMWLRRAALFAACTTLLMVIVMSPGRRAERAPAAAAQSARPTAAAPAPGDPAMHPVFLEPQPRPYAPTTQDPPWVEDGAGHEEAERDGRPSL